MTDRLDGIETAEAYDQWSETYDADANRTRDMAGRVLRENGLALEGRSVVEVGCGTGRNTEWLAERAVDVRAFDFSEGMLSQARARVTAGNVRFAQHDIRSPWPIEDGSTDVVIAMLVLEHIQDVGTVFAEAARSLRPGGDLFVCELHPTRQMTGRQAEFTNPRTGEQHRVVAFIHDVSEYVNAGVEAGLELVRLGEWRDDGAARIDLPRIVSVHLRKPNRP